MEAAKLLLAARARRGLSLSAGAACSGRAALLGRACRQQRLPWGTSKLNINEAGAPLATCRCHGGQAQHTPLQQERIKSDGSLSTTLTWYRRQQHQHQHHHQQQQHHHQQQHHQQQRESEQHHRQLERRRPRPPGLPAAAPAAPPVEAGQLEALAELLQSSRRVVLLSGAGCSTESNIPDYRGPTGAYTTGFSPMTHQQFVAAPENRARYWARSFAGWHEFAHVEANSAHEAISRLQELGWLDLVVTQNVDRLHHKGGSPADRVLELHGTTHRVVCLDCGANTCRHELQQQLAALNPAMSDRVRAAAAAAAAASGGAPGISNRAAYERALRAGTAADGRKVVAGEDAEQVPVMRPDGDVELADAGHNFVVPGCASCGGGRLKPDVVFFGDSVPKPRVESALAAVRSADTVLVVGSSLMVFSAYRLVKAAKEANAALAIINVGPTRADDLADLKVEGLAGEVMTRLSRHPSLLLPRAAAAAAARPVPAP